MSGTDPAGPDHMTEAFDHSGLNALLEAAVRAAPETVIMRDDACGVSAAELEMRARQLARTLRLAGLTTGERVCVYASPEVASVAAMIAVLRAGLEPAMVPAGCTAVELAAYAVACEAAALVGPTSFAGFSCGDDFLTAAALADTIRLVATYGRDPVDGALDVTFDPADRTTVSGSGEVLEAPMITTFAGSRAAPVPMAHRQAAMFADALSLVEQAHILPPHRVVSTLAPSSLAGLVLGPFAAFVGASGLRMHGPFSGAGFLAALDEGKEGVHLVVPAHLAATFATPQLTAGLTSLILLSRHPDAARFAVPGPVTSDRPLVDLYAFGEETVLAQRRIDGEARLPSRVADNTLAEGLGSRLNRARAEARLATMHRG